MILMALFAIASQLSWTGVPVIISCLATLVTAYIGLRRLRMEQALFAKQAAASADEAAKKVEEVRQQAKSAAGKVEEVKNNLERSNAERTQQLINLQRTADDTHTLVNNNMAIQLRINALIARRLAEMTNDADDIRVADEAERELDEHLKRQAIVDTNIALRAQNNNKVQ